MLAASTQSCARSPVSVLGRRMDEPRRRLLHKVHGNGLKRWILILWKLFQNSCVVHSNYTFSLNLWKIRLGFKIGGNKFTFSFHSLPMNFMKLLGSWMSIQVSVLLWGHTYYWSFVLNAWYVVWLVPATLGEGLPPPRISCAAHLCAVSHLCWIPLLLIIKHT